MKTTKKRYPKPVWMVLSLVSVLLLISNVYAFKSITSRENGVTVDVRPEQLINGQPVKFKVRMNTHSVNLGEDMVAVSELKDDGGKSYKPVNWQGSPPGGHHRNGVLEFPKLEGSPKEVTLIIRNVSRVPERVFEWAIE